MLASVDALVWANHAVFINNVRWERTWADRATYVHPRPGIHYYAANARVEHHEVIGRRKTSVRPLARATPSTKNTMATTKHL